MSSLLMDFCSSMPMQQRPFLVHTQFAEFRSSRVTFRITNPRRKHITKYVRSGMAFKKFEPELLEALASGKLGEHPAEDLIFRVGLAPLETLMAAARAVRHRRTDCNVVTFSPYVFIPLTRACRNSCGYCAFAVKPRPGQKIYMTPDEVLEVARKGVDAGCTEALFTLGDKPELLYDAALDEFNLVAKTSSSDTGKFQ